MCIEITERQARILNIIENNSFDMTAKEIYRRSDCTFENVDQVRSVLNILEDKGVVDSYYSGWCKHYYSTYESIVVSCGAYGNCKSAWLAPVVAIPVPVLVPLIAVEIPKLKETTPSALTGMDRINYLIDCTKKSVIPQL